MANISSTRFACQVANYASTVVDDRLYISGGNNLVCNVTAGGGCLNDRPDSTISNSDILVIDFRTSFTFNPRSIGTRIRVSDTLPEVRWGTLWGLRGKLYQFGGDREIYPVEAAQGGPIGTARPDIWGGVWEYEIRQNSWRNVTQQTEWGGVVPAVAFGSATCGREEDGMCYQLLGEATSPVVGMGMGTLLAYSVDRGMWVDIRNVKGSIEAVHGAQMLYSEVLDMLIVIGGRTIGSDVSLPMSKIKLFHIPSKTWYTQESTAVLGDFPPSRQDFCAVLATTADASSHNIYIYGGINLSINDPDHSLSDVWALTMPSFRWVQVGESALGRESLTCHLIGQRYMFTYGGRPGRSLEAPVCNTEDVDGVMFDVSTLSWTGRYERPAAGEVHQYQVPGRIQDIIGGGADGSAAPRNGFVDDSLGTIFSDAVRTPMVSTTPKPSAVPAASPEAASHNIGAIAGGVVAGAAVLVTGCVAFWLWWRKQRSSQTDVGGVIVPLGGRNMELESGEVAVREMGHGEIIRELDALQSYELPGSKPIAELD